MTETGEAILYSLLLGFFIGIIYTAIRIFSIFLFAAPASDGYLSRKALTLPKLGTLPVVRPPRKRGRIYRFLIGFALDLFFCLLAAVLLSVFVYSVGGIFRLSYVTLAVIGLLFFVFTLGKWTEALFLLILFGLRVLFLYLYHFLSIPIFHIFSFFRRIAWKSALLFKGMYDKIKISFYRRRYQRILIKEREKREAVLTEVAVQHLFSE